MIGPFGHELLEEVRKRCDSVQAREKCLCKECVEAEVPEPPVCMFEGYRGSAALGSTPRAVGRWLHGTELKIHLQKRAEVRAAVRKTIDKHTMKGARDGD